jgi:nitroreductase
MEVQEATRTLLAVRQYQDRPIPADLMRRIVEAAHLTGSSINKQPWHFVAVQARGTLVRLGELAPTGRYVAEAPLAVVVAIEKASPFGVSDASRAIQDMMLVAWAEGVGSNWVGFGEMEEVGKLLGIPPEMDVLAIVPFGYPAQAIGRGKKRRKPFSEVVSGERFGQPFA